MPLTFFCAGRLLLDMGLALDWLVCPVKLLEKVSFSFVSSYQLEIVSGLEVWPYVHLPSHWDPIRSRPVQALCTFKFEKVSAAVFTEAAAVWRERAYVWGVYLGVQTQLRAVFFKGLFLRFKTQTICMYSLVELCVLLLKLAGNILCPPTVQASSHPDSGECYVYSVTLNDRREPTVEF